LNVVSRLDVEGKLATNKVWKIKAKGATFDGRDLFRGLVSFNASENRVRPMRPSAGLDLEAELGHVLGHSGVGLRNVTLKLSDRDDKLTGLKVDGTLDGGQPLKVLLRSPAGKNRTVYADSTDAGQAFRLVGFYPNIQNGRVRLEVNLDGRGDAERTGMLFVEDFKVLGDAIVSEVVSSAPGGLAETESNDRSKKAKREVFQFDGLRVPFSAGHGQFVMEESVLRGPVLGATVRGKIDHNSKQLSLGGTYIPMQGINSALCGIPLVGQILTGAKCEGILGITYAVQGPMDNPQVIVNPFSMVAPGIFRDIFQMTNPNPQVDARDDPRVTAPVEGRVRASSSVVTGGEVVRQQPAAQPASAETVDGWSSTSKPAQKK
jgi:AsmA-like C-terminal region